MAMRVLSGKLSFDNGSQLIRKANKQTNGLLSPAVLELEASSAGVGLVDC